MTQKNIKLSSRKLSQDTNWQCTINLNNALMIIMKLFEYTGNQKCKLL